MNSQNFRKMKRKHLFTYFGLVIVFASSMIIYSCQKNQTDIDNSELQTEQSHNDAQLEKRIIAFRDQIDLIRENPLLKSGTDPMEIEDAVWYIEATANLTYGDASPELDGFVTDFSFISVPLTNGQILWTDVQIAYDQVIDFLSDHYASVIASEKQLKVADVSLEETLSDHIIIKINSGIATSGSPIFGANDHSWYWGWELGTCDNSGVGVGYDAADKIAELANISISVPSGNSYYTDVIWDESMGCQHASSNEECLFEDYQEYTLVHQCLSPVDITHYKARTLAVGELLKPSNDHSVLHYNVSDQTAFGSNYWAMAHKAEIKYGIWHISSDPPADL